MSTNEDGQRQQVRLCDRLVIAGTHSGVGKTTVSVAIMTALRKKGLKIAAAKVGPDFIDPTYHRLATGHHSVNLDVFLHGKELILPLAAEAAEGSDMLITEGVMGLFDDSGFRFGGGSTAEVAKLLQAPVILIIDCAAMSTSVKAVVHGFSTLDKELNVKGVILNRVASKGHELLLREALEDTDINVIGVLEKKDAFNFEERHLGLVPAVEEKSKIMETLDRLAAEISDSLDLEQLVKIANSAPTLWTSRANKPHLVGQARIGICSGKAFSFYYHQNLEYLQLAGAELSYFDPLTDEKLPPDLDALYMGGGFPEVYTAEISKNRPLLDEIAAKARDNILIWAECGGYLLLCQSIDGHIMSGILDSAKAEMTTKLTLGYRYGYTLRDTIFGPSNTEIKGHEYHYSQVEPAGEDLFLSGRLHSGAQGYAAGNIFASYLHQHMASRPEMAENLVTNAKRTDG